MVSKRAVRRQKLEPIFSRWAPRESSSWAFQVFNSYNTELESMFWSYITSNQYVYSNLKRNGAKWEDLPTKHFRFPGKEFELFDNLEDWSNEFGNFDNWTNLNVLMAISSTFETYLATIVSIALQSDPGVLLGSSKSVDGIFVLKYGSFDKLDYEAFITSCTKGDWTSRISSYKKIFGFVPAELDKQVSDLEAIRKLRNRVGHAFGRDIAESRNHAVKKIIPMDRLSRERVIKYQTSIWKVAKAIDKHLLTTHIGEFQALNFYHKLVPTLPMAAHVNQRAIIFKKKIGQSGVQTIAKEYCNALASFYESI